MIKPVYNSLTVLEKSELINLNLLISTLAVHEVISTSIFLCIIKSIPPPPIPNSKETKCEFLSAYFVLMNWWSLKYVNQEAKEPHRLHKEQWPIYITLIQSVLWSKIQYKHERKVMFKFGCNKLFGSWRNVSNVLSYFYFFSIIYP